MLGHVIALAFSGFVAYTAKPNLSDSTLFAWHPTFMSAAFALLAAAGIFILSRNSFISNRNTKVTGHWILMLLAAISAVLGFGAIYLTKEKYQKPHLATPHGIVGCVAICYILVQLVAGLNVLYPQIIATKFVSVGLLKKVHGYSATFLMLIATLATVGGVTTDWFAERVTGPVWYACIAAPLVVYALIFKQVVLKSKKETPERGDKKRT